MNLYRAGQIKSQSVDRLAIGLGIGYLTRMVGRKKFDTHEVLDQALILFWDVGYQAASYAALKETTGLNKSSLRNAFGDKQQLYQKCLEHYDEAHYTPILERLHNPNLKRVIEEHFELLFDRFAESHVRVGSLAALAALENATTNDEKGLYVQEQMARVMRLFENRFEVAVGTGELPKETDTKALAGTMVMLSRSLAEMFRQTEDLNILRGAVRVALKMLDDPPRR